VPDKLLKQCSVLWACADYDPSRVASCRGIGTLFTSTYILLRFKVSTCFGHYLPIFRRHYTTTAHNSHQICVRVVPPEDGQVLPETSRDFEP
jgi:hypothetical protein